MERLVSLNRIHITSLVTNSSNARSEKLSQGVIFSSSKTILIAICRTQNQPTQQSTQIAKRVVRGAIAYSRSFSRRD